MDGGRQAKASSLGSATGVGKGWINGRKVSAVVWMLERNITLRRPLLIAFLSFSFIFSVSHLSIIR